MKPYRTEHPQNGNNKFCFNLTIKPVWKKGYLQEFEIESPFMLQTSLLNTPIVRIDPLYFRPTEVDVLIGDPTKAKSKLGWEPKYNLSKLVSEMMESDIQLFKKDRFLLKNGRPIFGGED